MGDGVMDLDVAELLFCLKSRTESQVHEISNGIQEARLT